MHNRKYCRIVEHLQNGTMEMAVARTYHYEVKATPSTLPTKEKLNFPWPTSFGLGI
ncbi:hypothetical protein [Chryseobacterium taichungense]|uniref:hypothetical protein n=1 Tax=Chryseobacterium taichungense TaxID=295069 RepID=UPI0028A9FA83|nr:hypothetical protein [Chryseobacterium taichungense]